MNPTAPHLRSVSSDIAQRTAARSVAMTSASKRVPAPAVLILLCAALVATDAQAQFDAKYLDVGDFQHGFTPAGYSRDGDGRRWHFPAIRYRSYSTHSEAFWLGTKNWTDFDGTTWPYYVSRFGPRIYAQDMAFPLEHRLVAKWEPSLTTVDGTPTYRFHNPVDEIDPDLPADRMVETIWNMDVGATVRMRAYAFGNAYHDDYHLIELVVTNTGQADGTGEVNLPEQTLRDFFVWYSYRWTGMEQAARVGDRGQEWGKYTMLDVVGDGHREAPLNLETGEPIDFLAYYGWRGIEPAWSAMHGSNLGGPLTFPCCGAMTGDTVGRLSGADMNGEMVLYAPNSATDPAYDPLVQPHTIGFMDSDEALTVDGHPHEAYYEDGILTRERQDHTPEVSPSRMWPNYAWRIEPTGEFWSPRNDPSQGLNGGFAQTVAFGPYDLPFGESIRIVTVRAKAMLSFDAALHVGRAYKLSGNDDSLLIEYDANGDGEITCQPWGDFHGEAFTGNECLTKDQWVMTVRDSLFTTFYKAREVFERSSELTEYPIPRAPYPPSGFDVTRDSHHVALRWMPMDGGPARAGWEVYRTYGRPEWSPQFDGIRLGEAALPEQQVHRRIDDRLPYTCVRGDRSGCLGAMLPPDATAYDDTTVAPGADYFYYLVAVGEPQPVDPTAVSGTPGGEPLRSSRYFTQTYHPVALLEAEPVSVEHLETTPRGFTLRQNYPNPFNPLTTIEFSLPHPERVVLALYDALGREVAVLVDGPLEAGVHRVQLDATTLPSGVYHYTMRAGAFRETRRLVLMR